MEKIQDIIDRAMYGTPEVKPEERNLFLTTIHERIYIALTKRQVINRGMYDEVVSVMKSKSNLHLYVNGSLNYPNYSNYIQEASKNGVRFTIVNPSKATPFGLVLADQSNAINQTDIFIKDELYEQDINDEI